MIVTSRRRRPATRAARTVAAVTPLLATVTLLAAVALLAAVVACAPSEAPTADGGEWAGSITTEGNVTTIINESGSVWGGTATLVEEASIGVEAGPDEYMLGEVWGVFATDEHIYVSDRQVPSVRVYDLDGNHLRDLGGEGQGPGEYTYPALITADDTGRVFVLDARAGRFNVFSSDGDPLGTWPAREAMCCAYPMVPAPNGTLWMRRLVRDEETREARYGLQEFGPDGPVGEIRWPAEIPFEPITMDITVSGRTVSVSVPFSPRSTWVATHSGDILTGASDRYHFQVQSAEGAVLAVEKHWTPVPVETDEADWIRRRTIAGFRREGGGPEWNWDGSEMPTTKPAFSSLIAAHTGEIWVRREGPGERLADCAEDPIAHGIEAASEAPCWRSSTIIDAFDAEGRLLGEVEAPAGLRAFPAYLQVRGDQVVSVVEDDAGIIRVKRWRLVPPG